MYADRVEAESRLPIKDRLNGGSARRRQISGKRRREDDDDKGEHDLYEQNKPHVSRSKIGSTDLRLKLQRKNDQQDSRGGKGTVSRGARDLREKLSGISYSPMETDTHKSKPKPKTALEMSKPVKKNVIAETPVSETKRAANKIVKKSQQKTNLMQGGSMDSFLQSLGLEKYSITFQVEEVDMTALTHMTDEDLKALGIPMGPRKKILLALESKG